jgi:drug/metabolite transporter (DMT)-like permease
MYILIVPILGLFMKKKVSMKVWFGVVLATIGLYMLCMTSESFSLSKGDFLVLICAGFFSLHILIIDYFSPKADGVRMSCIQFFVCGIISMIIAFIFEQPNLGDILSGWLPILYAGVLSCGVAYTLQIVGQKNMDPTVASLILSLESVFSVLAGWVILNQKLSGRELFGCGLMFLAIIMAQLPEKAKSL